MRVENRRSQQPDLNDANLKRRLVRIGQEDKEPTLVEILAKFHSTPLGEVLDPSPRPFMGPALHAICEKIVYGKKEQAQQEQAGQVVREDVEPEYGAPIPEPLPPGF